MMADLRHVDSWIFDLDDTLYPRESKVMALVSDRMTEFMVQFTGLPRDEAWTLQKKYFHEYGTTLAGLMAHHGLPPEEFLTFVHDISLDGLSADAELREGLERLPGRRLIFTNGSGEHAERVLAKLGVADLFEDIFHIASADYLPKPAVSTFAKMSKTFGLTPKSAVFFEDSERNLEPAAAMGMTTVMVGQHALDSTANFVHHRTSRLPPFLIGARLQES
jgi:putative hydrolase of the HAD superfamily